MPRTKAKQVLWNTSWKWEQVHAEMLKKAPSRAALYAKLHTHEYMTTEAAVRAVGKDPRKNSDQTTILGALRILREQGLIVSELTGEGKGGSMKHKKCAKPLAVPQESPKAKHGQRVAKKRAARKGAAAAAPPVTNGGTPAKKAASHPDPMSNILDALKALGTQVAQLTALVEAEMSREAEELAQMEEMAQQLNERVAARKGARSAGRSTRH